MSRPVTALRTLAVGGAATAALALAPAADAMRPVPDGPGTTAQPTVNMKSVLLAAQLDSGRPSNGTTKGAAASVRRVQRALIANGVLRKGLDDGSYGPTTIAAYSAWQRKLGYSGIAANGLPGTTSLKRLTAGRFTVTRKVSAGKRTTWTGKTVDARTAAMLRAASKRVGGSRCTLGLTQGSYNAGGVDASKGTHDGGGVVDVDVDATCGKSYKKVVRVLRQVGFAAWHRTPEQGPWKEHIHAVAVSDPDLSSGAREQVTSYWFGGNGLVGNAKDDGPKVPKTTWEDYERTR